MSDRSLVYCCRGCGAHESIVYYEPIYLIYEVHPASDGGEEIGAEVSSMLTNYDPVYGCSACGFEAESADGIADPVTVAAAA